jgi:hypothetical protein
VHTEASLLSDEVRSTCGQYIYVAVEIKGLTLFTMLKSAKIHLKEEVTTMYREMEGPKELISVAFAVKRQ